ncbi:oxidoreductase, short chain dehydrogenase/reductase domain protein [Leptospira weilii str. Ecochallenge]|uniref:Oxidoreductase, short chain dehydrogenase/reductase domain protein n=1 Tax=Leptospira weilii str. Ecochallenge TaxID=1049986 RepID=N1UAN7_9LEPT|nr:oxidoreductase, short chain dehydrogenase/reductase domain protein [Leptospira weilii str. Ecochallenge]
MNQNKIPDILINCAGISVFTPFEDRTDEEFNEVVHVNLNGTFLLSQHTFRLWKEKGKKGVILNFGSIYGVSIADMRIYGDSGRNSPEVYAMTKAGIIHFTKYLARYAAPYGIRVNCISPGGIFANQSSDFIQNYIYKTPLGRMGNPSDLVGGVFLFDLFPIGICNRAEPSHRRRIYNWGLRRRIILFFPKPISKFLD